MEPLIFGTADEFRQWLSANCLTSPGIWMLFGKKGGPSTLTPQQALEEALCFGWIDGQMKSIDVSSYIKYFAPRRKGSNWSDRNKKILTTLEEQGRMTDHGRGKMAEARRDGSWDSPPPVRAAQEDVDNLSSLLEGHEPAFTNFTAMPPSVRKTYTLMYLDAKSEETRKKRLDKIIERLNLNLKPM